MDGNSYIPAAKTSPPNEAQDDTTANVVSIEQLQRLVRLLDNSDVSELELKRPAEGTHLLLRKATIHVSTEHSLENEYVPVTLNISAAIEPDKTEHKILAPLVGTFHTWAKPKGGNLVAVGDRVKAGQLVGTIESLNVLNEVESTVAGRVVEIFVQEGQPVEYGQVLMTIDSLAEG